MNTKLLEFALEGLRKEIEKLQVELKELKEKLNKQTNREATVVMQSTYESELMDTKEVQQMLGVCYNTLQKIVAKGLLIPIRVGQRRIRYSRTKILEYLGLKHQITY
jgi:hypothetical protein